MRSIYSGRNQFPIRNRQRLRMDPELEEKIAKVVAKQEAACGITHILAPVLDISRDSRMGRQGETYGEDPALAAALGAAYTKGIQTTEAGGRRPESVAKHFLGFHNSQGGIHGTNSDTPSRLMEEIYGKPFQSAISESELKGSCPVIILSMASRLPFHTGCSRNFSEKRWGLTVCVSATTAH